MPGDVVQTLEGAATVECAVRSRCPGGSAFLATLAGGLRISPGHPVIWQGDWRHPSDIALVSKHRCSVVYNFVLSQGHTLIVDGVPCVTLGASFDGSAVTWHSYWGSSQVLEDLRVHPSWSTGVIDWAGDSLKAVREGRQVEMLGRALEHGFPHVEPNLLQRIHGALMSARQVSMFRRGPVRLSDSKHDPPPAEALPGLVSHYCEETMCAIASRGDIFAAGAFCLWWVNFVHPLTDGNGRTARGLAWMVTTSAGSGMCSDVFAAPSQVHAPFHIHETRERYLLGLRAADALCGHDSTTLGTFTPSLVAALAEVLREVWQ